ncbi:MAG: hypothetical protein GY873_12935, partial [Bosea sp.]|nr:hypothetical protein [Bosea sp. (in: a-proteobacteria)]
MPCRDRSISAIALMLGAGLVTLESGTAQAACTLTAAPATYVCTGTIAGFNAAGAANHQVTIGNAGTDENASFTGGLTIQTTGQAIALDFATTSTPSSFDVGAAGTAITLSQLSSGSGNVSLTGMNAAINAARGITANVNTSGRTTIETVAGGTIKAGFGISYSNTHASPGDATITVGAAISTGGGGAVVVNTSSGSATTTVNLNADISGVVSLTGSGASTAIVNIGTGASLVESTQLSAIYLSNQASATVTNAGTIITSFGTRAVETDSDTTVNNTASGTVNANNGFLFSQSGAGKTLTVNNAGRMIGSGRNVSGSMVAISNSGSWTVISSSDFQGTATLDNSGTFSGNSYTATALTSMRNSGTVNLDTGSTLSTSGSYVQTAGTTAIATGATLTASGGYTQSGGRTTVDGTLTGAVTLDGGTLGGSGTVGGVSVASGGTIAPGNSIGTLTVSGNVSFASGSTYQVEVNAAGQSDRIVASGSASITGGTVQVL